MLKERSSQSEWVEKAKRRKSGQQAVEIEQRHATGSRRTTLLKATDEFVAEANVGEAAGEVDRSKRACKSEGFSKDTEQKRVRGSDGQDLLLQVSRSGLQRLSRRGGLRDLVKHALDR